MSFERVILIVMDSVGIGALPDASIYGDEGSNTLVNTAKAVGGLQLPHLGQLGLGCIDSILGVPPVDTPQGAYGKMAEHSAGKDTTTGHWEMTGVFLDKPFPVYPHGFPLDVIRSFEEKIQRKTLGNKVASGTVIIEELGEEHVKTGFPIVYTSADSVFQIAAHEEVIPLDDLYHMCLVARELLTGPHAVGRVIARPFVGTPGQFKRTANRRDYSLLPIEKTLLSLLQEAGYPVYAVGKIEDIFAKQGISEAIHTQNNLDGIEKTLAYMQKAPKGLIFANLVDFDMVYGHRNNPQGYAQALEQFDQQLPHIMDAMEEKDLLIITADHGCDPTTASTDHSREYVPLLAYGKQVRPGTSLGIRTTFSDVGATIAQNYGLTLPHGQSFLQEITIG